MPYNRVTNLQQTVMWLLVLHHDTQFESRPTAEINAQANRFDLSALKKTYIPGLMLVPIPEAGFLFGYIDWAFLAVLGYILGSIAYVVDSFYLWGLTYYDYSDDANNPQNYWNSMAAVLFVANALVCILDWWLQEKHLSLCNMFVDPVNTGGLKVDEIPIQQATYYFWNNFFFLGAAVIFLIQCIWLENAKADLLGCSETFCGSFWINFWGNMLYLLSSFFALLEYFANVKERKDLDLPPLYLFTCNFRRVDWFGWGDWLYFLISIASVFQSFLVTYIRSDDDINAPYYLSVNVLFLLDSIAYMIGYMLFVYDLRDALITGMASENNIGALNALLGDTILEMDQGTRESQGKPSMFRASMSLPSRPSTFYNNAAGHTGRTSDAISGSNYSDQSHPDEGVGNGRVSLAGIRRRLAEAQSIRQRRTIDTVRPASFSTPTSTSSAGTMAGNNSKSNNNNNNSSSNTAFVPTLSPIFDSGGINSSSSSSTIGGDVELGAINSSSSSNSTRARTLSVDSANRLLRTTSTNNSNSSNNTTINLPLLSDTVPNSTSHNNSNSKIDNNES